jgi:hypothetical protein
VQSGSINLWGVQLEIGSVVTPLEKLDPADDLRHCQRFYCVYTNTVGLEGNAPIAAANAYQTITWPTTMRAVPTTSGTWAGVGNVSTPQTQSVTPYGCQATIAATAPGRFYATLQNLTASADL